MCWTRQSGCAVTRSTTAFVSATDVKMVGKHASACGYTDDRTSSLCSSGGCMLFPLKESTSSQLFLSATGQHSLLVLHSFTNLVSLQPILFRHRQEATAYKYDIYLLPTTRRKFDFAASLHCAGFGLPAGIVQQSLRQPRL